MLNKVISVVLIQVYKAGGRARSVMNAFFLIAVLVCLNGVGILHAQSQEQSQANTEAPAKRIVALAPHTVELMYSLGAGERIIATTEFADYPPVAKNIPRVGGYNGLQLERIFEMQPDLVLAWDGGNKGEDIDRLEQLGLRVVRSQVESIDEIPEHLAVLGELMGMQASAGKVAQNFRDELAKIRDSNSHKARVRFFYQLWLEPLKTLTSDSWVNESLRSCGGENVFAPVGGSAYPQVSIENVLLKAPQVIIVPSHHGDVIATGEMWQTWPEIPAVAKEHIYYIDGDILHRPTLRVLEGMREICEVFDRVRADLSSNAKSLELKP